MGKLPKVDKEIKQNMSSLTTFFSIWACNIDEIITLTAIKWSTTKRTYSFAIKSLATNRSKRRVQISERETREQSLACSVTTHISYSAGNITCLVGQPNQPLSSSDTIQSYSCDKIS